MIIGLVSLKSFLSIFSLSQAFSLHFQWSGGLKKVGIFVRWYLSSFFSPISKVRRFEEGNKLFESVVF
jgi:hypothetical protein